MIKRLDLRNVNGKWEFEGKHPKNWIIEIFQEEGFFRVTALSKATNKDPVTEFPLIEGSLFLKNHTFNFYAFFRERKEQSIMDTFNIVKVLVPNEKLENRLYITEVNGEIITPIIYMRSVDIIEVNNMEFQVRNEMQTMNSSIVKFSFNDDRGFIIQKIDNRYGKDLCYIFLAQKQPLSEILSKEDTLMKVNTRAIMRMGR